MVQKNLSLYCKYSLGVCLYDTSSSDISTPFLCQLTTIVRSFPTQTKSERSVGILGPCNLFLRLCSNIAKGGIVFFLWEDLHAVKVELGRRVSMCLFGWRWPIVSWTNTTVVNSHEHKHEMTIFICSHPTFANPKLTWENVVGNPFLYRDFMEFWLWICGMRYCLCFSCEKLSYGYQ